jgi:lysophospholipase L1-like esterase
MSNMTRKALRLYSLLSRTFAATFALLLCLSLPAAYAQLPANPAVVPTDRLDNGWWADRHKAILAAIQSHSDTQLLMIGDSITNNYDKTKEPDENFLPIWKQFYEPRKALNLGFSGDTTSNLLWRIDHGEVDGLHPKVAVLLIGTNNTGHYHQTAEETELGIDAVIADLEHHLPQTHILLLGLLPSDISPEKTAADQAVNRYLATCYGDNARVTYLDIATIFYTNGALDTSIFYDPRLPSPGKALHPDTNSQRRMAEAIEPTLAKLMGDSPTIPLPAMTDVNTAILPVDWLDQDSYDWYARHHAELDLNRRIQPRVVLIGDSITNFWAGQPAATRVNGPTAWQQVFGQMSVLNLGFGWDHTQNVLWRLRQGEFDGLHPQWIVLNIGTNNLVATPHARANTPAETVSGIDAIIDQVHTLSPQSHIILMAIFPRDEKPDSPRRAPIQETNRLLAQRYAHDSRVTWLDIGAQFLAPDGTLPTSIMFDGTHPTDAGYRLWANALIQVGVTP